MNKQIKALKGFFARKFNFEKLFKIGGKTTKNTHKNPEIVEQFKKNTSIRKTSTV